jgi:hypothetical protein
MVTFLVAGCCSPNSSKLSNDLPLRYHNAQYGFSFYLPASWRGYAVVVQQWEGQTYLAALDRTVVTERGPILVLRHPQWTASDPYQDIPILVFTRSQWETHHAGTVGAGGVDEEIGHNSKYVFAISSRYNADDSVKGWKETGVAVQRNRAAHEPHLYQE